MSNKTVVTRFAPSPTGFLHCGSARTALYCWLYARAQGGQFILRIEDTDRERSTEEACQAIIEGMRWLALDWDQGPFYQTHRMDRYRQVLSDFLDQGHAYRCTCSKERLEQLRAEQILAKKKPRYDGHCRHKELTAEQAGAAAVIRFKNPLEGEVVVNDRVHGTVVFSNDELDDLIIARSDGTPTYNFCVVVDDADMGVTHVIRGDDHLNNTPRQINMLRVLGVEAPVYAHLPMILGKDGSRLSKRHGAVSVDQFRQEGILPEALLNYLVRLGWSHGDQEIFTRQELLDHFSLDRLNKAAAAFNPEKLLWLNQHYLKTLPGDVLEAYWHDLAPSCGVDSSLEGSPPPHMVIAQQGGRCKTMREMIEKSRFFYQSHFSPEERETIHRLLAKHLAEADKPAVWAAIRGCVEEWQGEHVVWTAESIHNALERHAQAQQIRLGTLAQPLRIMVSGGTVSPPLDQTLQLCGLKRVLERIQDILG